MYGRATYGRPIVIEDKVWIGYKFHDTTGR